ncbi:dihydroneopterin aldolase [Prosthecomicrobium pneumaticum]|uniref:7,8-dihydroneopterin aldolase n=1 Tax=Prosthecomicrobium pneumaticum TaxID=81895 RepID=A0A7W9L358_9HYPH|nr:dihydroneopterin aldolase [Prosthecomicrobium pneumaticum]MBB5754207.1 dihydroneopterin aldolase [Prosthecomicrobium pneumaticum]
MTDRILISDLRFFAFHGVYPEEETLGQRFRVDLVLEIDLADAAGSDAVDDTVSYAEIIKLAERITTGRRFRLIEALAGAIAQEILDGYERVARVTVRVTKPEAPVAIAVGSVAVEIERARHG